MKTYVALENIELPESMRYTPIKTIRYSKTKVAAFVSWPDQKPCFAINGYLLSNLHGWSGDTVLSYAAELTHLIRYCYRYSKRFDDLTDTDIEILITELIAENCPINVGEKKRNGNTVRRIMQRTFLFLDWYQNNLCSRFTPILGERNRGAAIICEKKKNPNSKDYYWNHRYLPEPTSTDPKLPIGLDVINKIEATIFALGDPKIYPKSSKKQCRGDELFFEQKIDYIYERRTFMIWIMKRTGLRPGEMVAMSVSENVDFSKNLQIIIPTLKRRKSSPPPREFSITPKDARVFSRYLRARERWWGACARRDETLATNDAFFLSTSSINWGEEIGKRAVEKDLERLRDRAGLKNQQTCFSMFRHRFITLEVLAHLREWEQAKGPITNEQDYRALLERVRIKTGHGSVESLFPYIDLARNMEGAWDVVDSKIEQRNNSDHLRIDISNLLRNVKEQLQDGISDSECLQIVIEGIYDRLGVDKDQLAASLKFASV